MPARWRLLNIAALALIALLGWRFLRTDGLEMLRLMEKPAAEHGGMHDHRDHHEHHHH